jgi:hypothetical protein
MARADGGGNNFSLPHPIIKTGAKVLEITVTSFALSIFANGCLNLFDCAQTISIFRYFNGAPARLAEIHRVTRVTR